MSELARVERSKMKILAVHAELSTPPATLLGDAKNSASLPWASLVLHVDRMRDIPEVVQPDVIWQSVSVINLMGWPLAMGDEPRQTMSQNALSVDDDLPVSTSANRSSDIAGLGASPIDAPNESPCFGVIRQQLSDAVDRKWLAHGI
jgi:hypothetical protein